MAQVKARKDLAPLSEPEKADFEERAAIMEFDGGLSTHQAERAALAIVRAQSSQARLRFGV
jgi:hypothetical protein